MWEATSVLNTSLSECSPNAVLEAMDLGCPVMVRDIPGNTCLVEHEITGLVFDTPDDFRRQAQRLVDDEKFAGRVGRRGREFIRQAHGPRPERAAYAAVLHDREPAAGYLRGSQGADRPHQQRRPAGCGIPRRRGPRHRAHRESFGIEPAMAQVTQTALPTTARRHRKPGAAPDRTGHRASSDRDPPATSQHPTPG